MLFSSSCPKCRESMLVGATRCSRCSYRPVPWEIRQGFLTLGLKLFVGAFVIGTVIFIVRNQ